MALIAFSALLVLSLGFALIPPTAPEPAVPPFSEQARASALAETMRLRAASRQLAQDASGAQRQLYSRTVTLLTIQARALALPADAAAANASPAPEAAAPDAAAPSPTGSGTAAPPSATTATVPALVAGLSASGKLRLSHAATADGGMARLLSSVGTGQLLQAVALAQASGTPVPALPAAPAPLNKPAVACPDPSAGGAEPSAGGAEPSAGQTTGLATASAPATGRASETAALARVVRTESETVYGYQVALTRLDGPAVQQARDLLARHEALVGEAETHSRFNCAPVPPREPGYTLNAAFLKNPAPGLASLEAGTLPVYGDLVALSEGPTRAWAIASLLGAAQRSILWGSDPGPVPGLVLDTSRLPPLPPSSSPADPSSAAPPPQHS
ncbi:DUF4439 domain-containing protein [Arthrobacter sp. ISL-28]|uniref:DUF4439 domain-containing protein n=1 Tax=Arthrobacter sp. ISL-28 TaxID=2819108 RepID=UPI001BEA2606|nr:DUF4439 domain-containing protein [Arthrobacter sp. ISL-28]MBT2520618.1 ferritin-like domain-containing protein [Arthrobacter sp. ISL-28]